MATVWLLMYAYYDDWDVLGIFSTHENAKQGKRDAHKARPSEWPFDRLHITEVTLDEVRKKPYLDA